ncbi:MAG: ROK family protein [Clostridia bacterium]|nr:ROK family protein [Clostridia bacterium]
MYRIGFDIGGTKCAVSLAKKENGKIFIMERVETPTLDSPQETLYNLETHVRSWKEKMGVKTAGISCGGPLNSTLGVIVCPPNLAKRWHGFQIVEYLKEHFGLSAKLQNDANACAVAEWRYGAGKGTKNMIFLTFGTGLGAGLILNGKLYAGANDNAGELGHIRLADKGPTGYGKAGSFEGFCSGGGIARLAVEMAKRCKKMPLCIEKMGGMSAITTKKLSEEAKAGDGFAKRVFAKSGEMLGKGLAIAIDILNPERIVLGGVFMRSSELLIPSMKKVLEREALSESLSVCEIVPAKLGENIGDVAAVAVSES